MTKHKPPNKQLEIKTNRTLYIYGNITTGNSERKDTKYDNTQIKKMINMDHTKKPRGERRGSGRVTSYSKKFPVCNF